MPRRKETRNRRPKGMGTVFESPKGSARWYARPPYKAGEVVPEKVPVENKEAGEELLRKWQRDREDKIKGGQGLTMDAFFDYWLTVIPTLGKKKQKSARTLASYRQTVDRHLRSYFAKKLLDEVEPSDIRLWLIWMSERKTPRNKKGTIVKPLATETIRGAYARLRAVFDLAVIDRRIRFNPCADVPAPESDAEPAGVALTTAQCDRLLAAAEGRWLAPLYFVALATGMRENELLGLRRNNVVLDGANPVIRVREQLQRLKGKWAFVPPKSKRSKRDIPLDADTAAVLRVQLAQVEGRANDDEAQWPRPDFWNLVFPSEVGTPIGNSNLLQAFRRVLKLAKLPEDLRFHDLRHTAGSLMLDAGALMHNVSRLLGHSSIAVTERIYAHPYDDTQREAVAGVARQLRKTGGA